MVLGASRMNCRWYPAESPVEGTLRRGDAIIRYLRERDEPGDVYVIDVDTVDPKVLRDLLLDPRRKLAGEGGGTGAVSANRLGLLLFLSQMRTRKGWSNHNRKSREFAANEFLVRVFKSYGLARTLYAVSPEGTAENGDALDPFLADRAILARWMEDKAPSDKAFVDRLVEIQDDARTLLEICQKELPTGDPLREAARLGGDPTDPAALEKMLDQMIALHQLGRTSHEQAETAVADACPWLHSKTSDGYGIAGGFLLYRAMAHVLGTSTTKQPAKAEVVLALASKLRFYEILRDLTEWLAIGAFRWARAFGSPPASLREPRDLPGRTVLRMLLVDEVFAATEATDPNGKRLADDLQLRLGYIAKALKDAGASVRFDRLDEPDGCHALQNYLDQRHPNEASRRLKVAPIILDGADDANDGPPDIFDYHIILLEIDQRGVRYTGPSVVQKLAEYFERVPPPRPEGDDSGARTGNEDPRREVSSTMKGPPTIMVLSQAANLSDIQQCLNVGALAYVRKERIYELPARVVNARIMHRWQEPKGRRSNFRSLYSLPPNEIVDLQSLRPDDLIHGDEVRLDGDAAEKLTLDPVDLQWIWRLPKADLHCHFGTFIDLRTIEALALNSVGYIYDRDGVNGGAVALERGVAHVIRRICALVEIAGIIHELQSEKEPHLAFRLARDWLDPQAGERALKEPKEDTFAEIISWLRQPHRQLDEFEVTSLLVACVCMRNRGTSPSARDRWDYLRELSRWKADRIERLALEQAERRKKQSAKSTNAKQDGGPARRRSEDDWLTNLIDRAQRQHAAIVGRAWRRSTTASNRPMGKGPSARYANLGAASSGRGTYWLNVHASVVRRCQLAEERLRDAFIDACGNLEGNPHRESASHVVGTPETTVVGRVPIEAEPPLHPELLMPGSGDVAAREPEPGPPTLDGDPAREDRRRKLFAINGGRDLYLRIAAQIRDPKVRRSTCPSLDALVRAPGRDHTDARDQSLLRYLRGATLLGADHLQYPENLLLAALSVVEQSVAENVWYSELRCESIGYAVGGMSALDATDLLCTAFTMASGYVAEWENRDKTDKTERKYWTQVNILLGAKRHKPRDRTEKLVALLSHYLQRSNGEIDHHSHPAPQWWRPCQIVGFDLSGDESKDVKNPAKLFRPLLELSAPITIHAGEAATAESIWRAVYEYGARRIGHGLRLREDSRLLQYCVNEGICLEFCPNSNSFTNGFDPADDYEQYHGNWREHYPLRFYLEEGLDVCICTDNRQLHLHKTLSSEYMRAASLVGGLTRWEILRIVKAGFKHAFLPKDRIEAMLNAVEDRVYDIVTGAPTPDDYFGAGDRLKLPASTRESPS